MLSFDPWSSLAGGLLIGVAASVMLLGMGRVAGISGIVAELALPSDREKNERTWRATFIAGLLVGGVAMLFLRPASFGGALARSPATLVAAGLLVGVGARVSGGCTSGHGLCGIGRFSLRSLIATLTFMTTGAVSVWLFEHAMRGAQ